MAACRSESKPTPLEEVRSVEGDLTRLNQALEGQDAVIIALALDAPQALDKGILKAAAEASVR